MSEDVHTTKNRLLDAAEELFSENNFDDVSVRELAAAAEVNVAAVNYHFQGKENLYKEVILRRFVVHRNSTLAALDAALALAEGQPTVAEVISALAREHLQAALSEDHHMVYLSVITRELMANKTHAHEAFFREMIVPVFKAFSQALVAAQPSLKPDDLSWIIASVIGQIHHFVLRWKKKEALDPDSEVLGTMIQIFPALGLPIQDYIQQVTTHITRFSSAAIEALYAEVE